MLDRQKNSLRLALFCCFLLAALGLFSFQMRTMPAPDVSIKTITNKTINLSSLRGRVVLITFWASNCRSCLQEIAHFKSLYNDYHQAGLEIIAIAMQYDRPDHVVATRKSMQIPYDIALDLTNKLAVAFGDVSLIPTTILINPNGDIVYNTTGIFDLANMQTRIESLITQ